MYVKIIFFSSSLCRHTRTACNGSLLYTLLQASVGVCVVLLLLCYCTSPELPTLNVASSEWWMGVLEKKLFPKEREEIGRTKKREKNVRAWKAVQMLFVCYPTLELHFKIASFFAFIGFSKNKLIALLVHVVAILWTNFCSLHSP